MTNHYDVLQISEDADESTIKRAWARLVRQYPPDKDPEGNRRLNEAKTTLLDTRARADYDAELKYGDEINALFEEGQEAMEEEDYVKAVAAFKEVLALHPDSLHARNQLSLAYAYQERYAEAVQQLKRLVEKAPESALYAANLGRIYMEWSESDEHNTLPFQIEHQAEIWFKKATELESYNSGHHIALARLYIKQNRYAEAEAALENAISADGKVDTDDIDTLMELTWVYLFSNQKHRIAEVAERIRLIIQDEPDANEYALHQFVRMAVNLIVEHNAYQYAEAFVKAARQLGVDMEEKVQEVVESIEKNALIDRQADAMREDKSIHPSVVGAMLAASAHKRLDFDIPEQFFDELSEAMTTWAQDEIRSAVKVCKRKYSAAYASIEDIIEEIIKLGRSQGGSKARRDTIDIDYPQEQVQWERENSEKVREESERKKRLERERQEALKKWEEERPLRERQERERLERAVERAEPTKSASCLVGMLCLVVGFVLGGTGIGYCFRLWHYPLLHSSPTIHTGKVVTHATFPK